MYHHLSKKHNQLWHIIHFTHLLNEKDQETDDQGDNRFSTDKSEDLSSKPKNSKIEAMKKNPRVQALLDAVINDGIPANKRLDAPILKIAPSFN